MKLIKKRNPYEVTKSDRDFWEKFSYKVPDLPNEVWKQIPNTMYYVSNKARVKRCFTERVMHNGESKYYRERLIKPQIQTQKNGRQNVYIPLVDYSCHQRKFLLSRLVAAAFIPNPDPKNKIQVNHIDENPLNNLPDNLEWTTPQENVNHGTHNKRVGKATKERWAKMTAEETEKAIERLVKSRRKKVTCDGVVYKSATEFAKQNGLNRNTVGHWFTGYVDMPEEWKARGLKYLDE